MQQRIFLCRAGYIAKESSWRHLPSRQTWDLSATDFVGVWLIKYRFSHLDTLTSMETWNSLLDNANDLEDIKLSFDSFPPGMAIYFRRLQLSVVFGAAKPHSDRLPQSSETTLAGLSVKTKSLQAFDSFFLENLSNAFTFHHFSPSVSFTCQRILTFLLGNSGNKPG